MLLTGGNMESFNTMTASWGQLGVLWNKNVLTCYIRPNRYTYEFVENGEFFTVSFLGEEYRKALAFCGSHSGRDCNKITETGLTPVELDSCECRFITKSEFISNQSNKLRICRLALACIDCIAEK